MPPGAGEGGKGRFFLELGTAKKSSPRILVQSQRMFREGLLGTRSRSKDGAGKRGVRGYRQRWIWRIWVRSKRGDLLATRLHVHVSAPVEQEGRGMTQRLNRGIFFQLARKTNEYINYQHRGRKI